MVTLGLNTTLRSDLILAADAVLPCMMAEVGKGMAGLRVLCYVTKEAGGRP